MKKLSIIIALFVVTSCRTQISPKATIVSEISLNEVDKYIPYKYKVYIRSAENNLDPWFYTDTPYQVGDTIYFSTKP